MLGLWSLRRTLRALQLVFSYVQPIPGFHRTTAPVHNRSLSRRRPLANSGIVKSPETKPAIELHEEYQ